MRRRCSVLHILVIVLTVWTRKKTQSYDYETDTEDTPHALIPDYEYVAGFGWYRLHTIPAIWEDARLRCNMEGGALATPTSEAVIKLMKKTMNDYGITANLIVDVIASKPKGNFASLDGLPLLGSVLQWATNEPNNLGNDEDCIVISSEGKLADVSCHKVHQYICVKTEAMSRKCDTTDKEYKMVEHTGSCYKFHPEAVPWRRAAMVCASEHANLAVINSKEESQLLKNLFAEHPESTIKGATYPNIVSMGFLDWEEERIFLTVFGQTLEKAGYAEWSEDQPDIEPGEDCGAMARTGKLENIGCILANQPFICEVAFK